MHPSSLERTDQRRELAAFLRSRRNRLVPTEIGLTLGPRRRTPGLRREEVAQVAGVGLTWYTWLEQGRDITVSTHMLDNLCRALRLDTTERAHLFALAQHRPPPLSPTALPSVSPALRRLVESLPTPAYVKTARWDVLAWNSALSALLGDFGIVQPQQRNLVWLVFTDLRYRSLLADWDRDARRILAKFRSDYGLAGGDPAFEELLDNLRGASPEFERWWPQQDVDSFAEGLKRFRVPGLGLIEFEYNSFFVGGQSDLRFIVYAPLAGNSTRQARRLFSLRSHRRKTPG
jgi:transcriptional regulator with XRE-family HTH domain